MSQRVEKALAYARLVRTDAPRPFLRNREHKDTLLLSHAVTALALELDGVQGQLDVLESRIAVPTAQLTERGPST